MLTRIACVLLAAVVALTAGCGDTEPTGEPTGDTSSSTTGVPYNDKDNDGKAPAEG